ncbi:hypothetical protein, partial [Rhodovulum sulfidophilum]|uniref:hypothetical protein n=1 Tax=Rhodovulum sulfidophilum TaxID=35806 RepID=UPI001F1998A8
ALSSRISQSLPIRNEKGLLRPRSLYQRARFNNRTFRKSERRSPAKLRPFDILRVGYRCDAELPKRPSMTSNSMS